MTTAAAELETEVRRLRIRIISLSPAQLDEATATASSRRQAIVDALAEFSTIASAGREVPWLSDQALADQIVVLLEHGLGTSAGPPQEEQIRTLTEAAVRLRRTLA
ncbi:hypothetical protein [Brevibacterium atlanticum]|uniref:hypothetical protein n=1 Tax=Brevibacterium atlanticum TaxID=2697563 RepID=UPI00142026C6|nr:hypothetical protein [Brevibacterium atlanticum]